MATPKQHIDHIRKTKFSIGAEENPLTEDLHHAVKNLSAELYAKDVHFLMEIIQNAEDNEYSSGVTPSLQFIITSRDITQTGASATLLIFNNEKGFSAKNIESVCSVGRSTKKGHRKQGYIGEKGIGFKSVFLITAQPHIFSNGYKIRFNEKPCPLSNLGYIVPEWVDENPSLSDISKIYGSGALPATTIVLPLKDDKVKPVKEKLSSIHPEVLLFLTKIKNLSVKEDNEDPKHNTVSAVSISSETNYVTRKNIDAESYTLHLSAEEKSTTFEKECSYYMWKQRFPVKNEYRVDRRSEVEEWVITLAFPQGKQLSRGMSSPGVYAFLPTEMVTNFPFIIQADFLLASSRETILLDNKWNQGILGCVSTAFTNAFIAMVKTTVNAPMSNLPSMFKFLPVGSSSYQELNGVRESIRSNLVEESIVPCESYSEQKFFYKPHEVGRLLPAFWSILLRARTNGVNLANLSSHGRYILSWPFDQTEYDHILNFLGVNYVKSRWYPKCIQSSNLVLGASDDVYLELLVFVAENWSSFFQNSNMKSIPLLKYVGYDGSVSLCNMSEAARQTSQRNLLFSQDSSHVGWLVDWNKELGCLSDRFFLPKSTQEALRLSCKRGLLLKWLKDYSDVSVVTVSDYASLILKSLGCDKNLAIAFVHFLSHSLTKKYMHEVDVKTICDELPLIDNYGRVSAKRKGVLVPAKGSKWVELIGSNPWRNEGYIELSEVYLNSGSFGGVLTPTNQLLQFLKSYVGASDIPNLSPPNAAIPTVAGPLTKANAFLLLDWIKTLRYNRYTIPERFLTSIKEGSWLQVSLSGGSGYRPPSQSFILTESCGNILQSSSPFVDIPVIDKVFYGQTIMEYTEELRAIGVMTEYGEACEYIGNHLMSIVKSSVLTKANVFSMLNFIMFLRANMLPTDKFVNVIKKGSWMKTSVGYSSPAESVLFDREWQTASEISDIPFVDKSYYGEEIDVYKTELQLLGVVAGFTESNYELVMNCLKDVSRLTSMTPQAFQLILKFIRWSKSSANLVNSLKTARIIKTNNGYKAPTECFLGDSEWGGLLQVFNCFSLIDTQTYGNTISSFGKELKMVGVKVDLDDAVKAFTAVFRERAALLSRGNNSQFDRQSFLSFLDSYKKLKSNSHKFPEFMSCVREVKWIRTRLGDYVSPKDCILFGSEWAHIAPIALLPFIDDNIYYGKEVHDFKSELRSMGVVINLKEGVRFIADGLRLPADPSHINPASVMCLLECIRIIQTEHNKPLCDSFKKKIQTKWVRTYAGYRSPNEGLLFDSKWGTHLQQKDGPFIDMQFYGNDMMKYRQELNGIGVVVDVEKGGNLLYNHLSDHSDFTTIVRVYNYLSEVKWVPSNEVVRQIWIPDQGKNGKWVSPSDCVLHDKDGLFGSRLHVLEKLYDRKLLSFFSCSFDVKSHPSVDDYCMLWKDWESSGSGLSHAECCAFWGFMSRHWSSNTEKSVAGMLQLLPVNSGIDGVLLVKKIDVFVADDLLLKDLLDQSSSTPIFVWFPQSNLPALPRNKLLEIYSKIGVRTVSQSVVKEELSISDGVEINQVKPADVFIGEVLVKIILGFLASASINMEPEKRHKAVSCLLNLTVLETAEPISVSYSLKLSAGIVSATASRKIRWDKEKSNLFVQKMDKSGCFRNKIEHATYFSEVIAKGVLWEYEDHINSLTELIKLCFLMEFNEDAVGFLMKSKNLLVYEEDEEFLVSAFTH